MRLFILISLLTLLVNSQALSQKSQKVKPTVNDLKFLIGEWEITFDFYDTHHPEKGIWFTEEGTMKCEFDMFYNGKPRFITCKGKVKSNSGRFKGREREFRESIRYGNFVSGFERVGIYSNWPGTAEELLFYYPEDRKIEIKGQLRVREGLERYEDVYQFNEDYTSFTRRNVANFPDMPVPLYNLTLTGTGKKIKS